MKQINYLLQASNKELVIALGATLGICLLGTVCFVAGFFYCFNNL